MEKQRADKLNHAGIMIQKTIKAWMQWRKYQRLRKATVLLQARARGLLARRLLVLSYTDIGFIFVRYPGIPSS